MYKVYLKKSVLKQVEKLRSIEQKKFKALVNDIIKIGPIQERWSNYSKLSDTEYHCHLSYKWIACWKSEKNTILVEVYYVGSRENAPY